MAKKRIDGLGETKEAPDGGTSETSQVPALDCTDDYTAETADSQEMKSSGVGRTRVYAIVVYADSALDDWRERLVQEHVAAFISPYHDQDVNPDGTQKKPHWHVLVMYDSVKSQAQVDAMWDRVLGPNRVKHYETVNSTRGYARYLCHLDNPEKAQYSKADVESLGGADYEEAIQLGSDDRSTLRKVFEYIRENNIWYYDELVNACLTDDLQSMFALITEKRTLAVTAYLKSYAARMRAEQMKLDRLGRSYGGRVDTSTGELLEGDNDNVSQD